MSGDFWEGIAPESMAAAVMAIALSSETPDNREALRTLLQNPACLPDFAGTGGKTPLMAAAARGNAAATELLAAHPLVSLGRQDKDGWTALHYAAAAGNADCVRILLAHRAPHSTAAKDGRTPLEMSENPGAAAAFWENRDFVRHMKVHAPDHPALQPPPEPVAEAIPEPAAAAPAAPATPPEAEPIKDAFFRAVTGVGLQWKLNPGMDVKGALIDKMVAMTGPEFAQSYKTIRGTNASFDWPRVFISAASAGNTSVMRYLHDEILFDQRTLNQAMSASIATGDQRDVAHHLAMWGANPMAPYELNGQLVAPSILEAAFRKNFAGTFEEMALWCLDGPSKTDSYRLQVRALSQGRLGISNALELREKRLEFKKMRGGKLKDAFQTAVAAGDINRVMAAYAESRGDRFLRGNIEVTPALGGGAIAVALRHEKYEFARLLIAEGFALKDSPEHLQADLRLNGTAKAKQFAEEHLSGKMKVISVPDVGRKRRSEIQILTFPPFRGHYGMF